MKQGKVFDKLAARKNVSSIVFGDKSCTVTLTSGTSKVCNSAHEARLFVEGKDLVGSVTTVVPAGRAAAAKELAAEAVALCGTSEDAKTFTVPADYVRERAFGLCNIADDVVNVRVTAKQLAALVVAY